MICTRHGDVEHFFVRIERDAIRNSAVIDQSLEFAARGKPVDAAAGIVHAGLSLIRKVEIAVAAKRKVVAAFEAFRLAMRDNRRNLAALRIEHHDAMTVVCDEHTSIPVYGEPVRPAMDSAATSQSPRGVNRSMRPNGMSTTYKLPARSNAGPSRNEPAASSRDDSHRSTSMAGPSVERSETCEKTLAVMTGGAA